MRGELLTTEETIVSVSQVFSYVECAVLCGAVHECRAGEFNSDLLTCTVIGEYQSSGHIPKSEVVTYIRQTFWSQDKANCKDSSEVIVYKSRIGGVKFALEYCPRNYLDHKVPLSVTILIVTSQASKSLSNRNL